MTCRRVLIHFMLNFFQCGRHKDLPLLQRFSEQCPRGFMISTLFTSTPYFFIRNTRRGERRRKSAFHMSSLLMGLWILTFGNEVGFGSGLPMPSGRDECWIPPRRYI